MLNESFGGDDLPDTTQDVTKLFNRLATAAGVVVVASSGDQGTANTIGSPASDSAFGGGEISVGATTQFQGLAQTTRGAYQLGQGGWLNDNIANFSSGGFTQAGPRSTSSPRATRASSRAPPTRTCTATA